MNINIFWNCIEDLIKDQLGFDKSNMFNNHMPISFSYNDETILPPIKDKKKKNADLNKVDESLTPKTKNNTKTSSNT